MTIEIADRAELPLLRRPQEERRWHVLVARYKKEIDVRDELRARGLEAYVPMQYALTRSRVRRRVLRPAINGMVFVRATITEIFDFRHSSRLGPYIFVRSWNHGYFWEPLVVTDAAMANFMQLTALTEVPLQYFRPEEIRLEQGDDVRIMDGPFEGIVGRVQRLPRHKGQFLVVEIPGVTTVVARLKPQFVEPLTPRVALSQHVAEDVKRLSEVATTLLYRHPTDTATELSRSTLLTELRTLRQSLEGAKTVMNSDRAAYALAHLLASLALGEGEGNWQAYLDQLKTTAPKLKTTSQVRQRASIYLSLLANDEEATAFVRNTILAWNATTATTAQRAVMAEWKEANSLEEIKGS